MRRRLTKVEQNRAERIRLQIISLEFEQSRHKAELQYCVFQVEQAAEKLAWWKDGVAKHRKGLNTSNRKLARARREAKTAPAPKGETNAKVK